MGPDERADRWDDERKAHMMKLRTSLNQDAVGYRRDGRPIYRIAGAAEDHDDSDDGQDNDQDGGDGSQDDGQQQRSILDDDDDSDDGDGGDGDEDDAAQLSPGEIRKLIKTEAHRIADRRINQALQKDGRKKQQSGGQRRDQQPQASGPSDGDVREARLAYREYVGDEIKFLSNDERAVGAELAAGLIRANLADGNDVEDAGRQAASKVAEQVRGLRGSYERKIIDKLKRTGQLSADYAPQQQPKSGGRKKGGTSVDGDYGLDMARSLYGDEVDQQKSA